MTQRHKNAWLIWNGGASNPRAVARALVTAVDEATENGSDGAKDAAVQMIMDHLCFLCDLPQPSLDMQATEWSKIMGEVMREANNS